MAMGGYGLDKSTNTYKYKELSSVEVLKPWSNISCPPVPDLPDEPDQYVSKAEFLCGGYDSSNPSKSCLYLNDKLEWKASSIKLPYRLYGAASVMVHKQWWITGGEDWEGDRGTSKTLLLTANGTSFVQGVDLPEGMLYHCMATINESMVFIAGNFAGDATHVSSNLKTDFTRNGAHYLHSED